MDEYFCVKIHYRTAFLLLLLIAHIDANSLWLWTEGCHQITGNGTVHNITDNSPVTCFQACGNSTKAVALQGNGCVCEFSYNKHDTVSNIYCSDPCSGNDIVVCGGLKKRGWSVYKKANEAEVAEKQLPINMTGCVTVQPGASNVYTLLPCNYTKAYHICHGLGSYDCSTQLSTSPNWTFACGYGEGQSSLSDRYPVEFKVLEPCIKKIRNIYVDFKYWTGLISLESREPSISPTPSDVAGSSTLQTEVPSSIYSTTTSTLIPSFELGSTSYGFVGFENDTNVITNISELLSSVHSNMTELPITNITEEFQSSVHISTDQLSDKSKAITLHQSTSVSKTHLCSASSCIYSSPIRSVYETQTRSISPTIGISSKSTTTSLASTLSSSKSTTASSVSTSSSSVSTTTSSVSVNEQAQAKQDSVSTTVAITAGAVALCALLLVIGVVIYIRKHVTEQSSFGSTNGSEFGRNSGITMATFQNNYPSQFQDETSEAIIRSVHEGEDIPNLSYVRRANLHMSNTLSSMHSDVPWISRRATGNEYSLY